MSEKINKWTKEMWQVLLNSKATKEVVEEARVQWNEYQDQSHIRVVIFGAYDAGKSTLIKRLLVEDGTELPSWLRISGRRETFKTDNVHSNGLEYVDTPGLGSGNEEHDALSIKSLNLSDAYLWVLPNQLLTTGKTDYIKLLEQISDNVPSIIESTIVAIARMEEAGIDPIEDLDGYKSLIERKKKEFKNMILNNGIEAKPISANGVSADPYETVGNNENVTAKHYEMGKGWDGIQELRDCLKSLAVNKNTYRILAGARFVGNLAVGVKNKISEKVDEYDKVLETLNSEINHYTNYKEELHALKKKLDSELNRDIEEELLSSSRSNTYMSDQSLKNLETSLINIIDKWSKYCNAEIQKAIKKYEMGINHRIEKPNLKGLRDLIDNAELDPYDERKHEGIGEKGKRVMGFGPAFHKAFEKYAESELGTTLKTATDVIGNSQTSTDALKDYVRNTPLKNMANFEKASKYVKWDRAMTAIGPIVEQLGGLLFDIATEQMSRKRAEERSKYRKKIKHKLKEEAENIESEASQNLETVYNGISDWIDNRLEPLKDSKKKTETFLEGLKQHLEEIDAKLYT